jgi:nicotinate-nucleotide adenylyltransferase
MRVALVGGSFNPPHLAHLLLAAQVLASHEPDEVWLAPAVRHAFGKPLAPFEDRLAMVELAVAPLGPRIRASRVEAEAAGAGSTGTTVELLRFLRGQTSHELLLVVGADILLEKDRWASFDEVERLARLVVVNRAGYATVEGGGAPLPEISSTDLRERFAKGLSVAGLVPAAVERYVREKQLYSAKP